MSRHINSNLSFIKQLFQDAFHVDCHLLTYPYLDAYKIDHGFRDSLWRDFNSTDDILKNFLNINEYHLYCLKSNLGFFHLVAFTSLGKNPDLLFIGPFLISEMPEKNIIQFFKEQSFSKQQEQMINHFYDTLPIINLNDCIMMFQHILNAYIPHFHHVRVEYTNFAKEHQVEVVTSSNIEFVEDENAESIKNQTNLFLDQILAGNAEEAFRISLELTHEIMKKYPYNQLYFLKRAMNSLNCFCLDRLLLSSINANIIYQNFEILENEIALLKQKEQGDNCLHRMAKRYSNLISQSITDDYSFTVREILNYVKLHLDEPIQLSQIAEALHKNPTYLSKEFKKETSLTITDYIQHKKIQKAITYFKDSEKTISEISLLVGYEDFAYFSRVFKKITGKSPRAYRSGAGDGGLSHKSGTEFPVPMSH